MNTVCRSKKRGCFDIGVSQHMNPHAHVTMPFHLVMVSHSQAESQEFTKIGSTITISRINSGPQRSFIILRAEIKLRSSPKCSPPSYCSKTSERQHQHLVHGASIFNLSMHGTRCPNFLKAPLRGACTLDPRKTVQTCLKQSKKALLILRDACAASAPVEGLPQREHAHEVLSCSQNNYPTFVNHPNAT